MKKKCGLNHAMQEGLLLLLLGGWLLWYSVDAHQHSYIKDWTQSPSLFPAIVACLLGVFGVIIFRQGIVEKTQEKQNFFKNIENENVNCTFGRVNFSTSGILTFFKVDKTLFFPLFYANVGIFKVIFF